MIPIDIIIPVYGALDKLGETLAHLEEFTSPDDFNLFIIDDAGPEWEPPQTSLKYFYHRNERNIGFGRTLNFGAQLGSSSLICFLNSDCLVTQNWLSNMVRWFNDKEVGVVGARLVFPKGSLHGRPGRIQHAGVARMNGGIPYHPHMHEASDLPVVMRTREVNAVTGALLMTRRDLFEELEGFSTIFIQSAFEDVDYCWRVREKGFKVIYDPEVLAFHYVNSSGAHAMSGRNLRKLLGRWGGLESDENLFDIGEDNKRKLPVSRIRAGEDSGRDGTRSRDKPRVRLDKRL